MKQVEQVKQVKQVEHVVTSHEVSSEVEAKSLRDVTVPQLQLRVLGGKMSVRPLTLFPLNGSNDFHETLHEVYNR